MATHFFEFWGKIDLYVFIFLGIIILYPLYKTFQSSREKELRKLSIFVFIFMVPIVVQGVGSFGVLADIEFLKPLSLTTHDYITMIWSIGIFIAILIGFSGIKDLEDTISLLKNQDEVPVYKEMLEYLNTLKEDLNESNRLKDIFTDIMRHDLLNPIGMIKSYVELLEEEEMTDDVKEMVVVISECAEKATEMIESASQLAKLEKEDELELRSSDLGKMVKGAVNDFKMKAQEKNISLISEIDGEHRAKVNPILYDVFANLVSNAVKYSPEGTQIKVWIENSKNFWKISVKDEGEGIPDEYKKDVFDRFIRIHKGAVEGTGLGLTIVKKIVVMHGGEVWVEDNPDKRGSIFSVTILREN